MKIVTTDQMRQIEARSEKAGMSTDALMERAGLEVARRVRHHLGPLVGVPVTILVGPGNNGGDGLVVARHLHAWGARVTAYLCLERREPDPKLALLRQQGPTVIKASEDKGFVGLRSALDRAHMVVDSVLGTGQTRPIKGALETILAATTDARARRPNLKIIAVDVPTGLNADSGATDPACLRADVTVTLGYPKAGLYAIAGADRRGAVERVDIGLPSGVDGDVALELMTSEWARTVLPDRPMAAHKGSFGKTLVVAGSRKYVGAAHLAASAATRVGAGLVTIALPESLRTAVAARSIEPTYLPLPESSPGIVSDQADALILDSLAGYDALLLGCGLGQETSTRAMMEAVLYSGAALPPTVVDADGLNILSMTGEWWKRFPTHAIVTPHPGEMARLTSDSTEEVQADRTGRAVKSASEWNKIVVLKGAFTVVALLNGRATISPFANPALASAGTGDVLAGAVAGLLSQGLGSGDAAALAVYIHGLAGERVRKELGDTGAIASDLLPALPLIIKGLREGAA